MNQYILIFSTISVYWSYSLGLDFAYPKYLSFGRGKLNEKIRIISTKFPSIINFDVLLDIINSIQPRMAQNIS